MRLRLAPAGRALARALKRISKDWQWWLALAAGPLFWGLLLFAGQQPSAARPLTQPLAYLHLALVMPVVEELVFRGWLQGWLLEQSWGARRRAGLSHANLMTSALFALAHLINHAPLWALGVYFPSLVFGYFRERHASVTPAILLHVAYNAGYFWWFFPPAI